MLIFNELHRFQGTVIPLSYHCLFFIVGGFLHLSTFTKQAIYRNSQKLLSYTGQCSFFTQRKNTPLIIDTE